MFLDVWFEVVAQIIPTDRQGVLPDGADALTECKEIRRKGGVWEISKGQISLHELMRHRARC
ncbi:hypothetical protein TUM18999_48100 [Pseudomonas tohonis]|uniref:Uncharacterized protein n=1 Tax=Pseudomonas tohonis TaxID=2725477 RepID=A0A6J4EBA1_9PSED|nr:hypothetical protein [Pseudomonas tohonis]BCG26619.1 hypothetical protein TUM18999_48100 [Pseudomonas tohonis]GJN50646.1 hypothetical protein TUM20286_03980 [Pseudomonas tohonis]